MPISMRWFGPAAPTTETRPLSKIDMGNRLVGRFQDVADIEGDGLEIGCQQIAVGVRQRRQKAIA